MWVGQKKFLGFLYPCKYIYYIVIVDNRNSEEVMISAISSFNTKGVCFSGNPAKGLKDGAKVAENVAERASRKVPKGLTPGKKVAGRPDDDEHPEAGIIALILAFASLLLRSVI